EGAPLLRGADRRPDALYPAPPVIQRRRTLLLLRRRLRRNSGRDLDLQLRPVQADAADPLRRWRGRRNRVARLRLSRNAELHRRIPQRAPRNVLIAADEQ